MNHGAHFFTNVREELKDGRRWLNRSIVLACACPAGLCVVAFSLMADSAFAVFMHICHWQGGWAVLLWMPAVTAAVV